MLFERKYKHCTFISETSLWLDDYHKLLHTSFLLKTNFWVAMKYIFKEKVVEHNVFVSQICKNIIWKELNICLFKIPLGFDCGNMVLPWVFTMWRLSDCFLQSALDGSVHYLGDLSQPRPNPQPYRLRNPIFIRIN